MKLLQEERVNVPDVIKVNELILQTLHLCADRKPAIQCTMFLKKLVLLKGISVGDEDYIWKLLNWLFPVVDDNDEMEMLKTLSALDIADVKKTHLSVRQFVLNLLLCTKEKEHFLSRQVIEEIKGTTMTALQLVFDLKVMVNSFLEPSALKMVIHQNKCTKFISGPVGEILKIHLQKIDKNTLLAFIQMVKSHQKGSCTTTPLDLLHAHLLSQASSDDSSGLMTTAPEASDRGLTDISQPSNDDKQASAETSLKKRCLGKLASKRIKTTET